MPMLALLLTSVLAAAPAPVERSADADAHARRVALVGTLSSDERAQRYEVARRKREACADCALDPVDARLILGAELQIDAMSVAQCMASHARKPAGAGDTAVDVREDNARFAETLGQPDQLARLEAARTLLDAVPGASPALSRVDRRDPTERSRALYHELMMAPQALCRAHDRIESGARTTVVDRGFPGTCRNDDGILVQSYAMLLLMDALAAQYPAECALLPPVRERMALARTHFPDIAAAMPPPPGPFDP